MEQAAAHAAYADLHEDAPFHDGTFTEWSKKRTRAFPYHFDDGVDIRVAQTDVAPWDYFTTQQTASPIPPVKPDQE